MTPYLQPITQWLHQWQPWAFMLFQMLVFAPALWQHVSREKQARRQTALLDAFLRDKGVYRLAGTPVLVSAADSGRWFGQGHADGRGLVLIEQGEVRLLAVTGDGQTHDLRWRQSEASLVPRGRLILKGRQPREFLLTAGAHQWRLAADLGAPDDATFVLQLSGLAQPDPAWGDLTDPLQFALEKNAASRSALWMLGGVALVAGVDGFFVNSLAVVGDGAMLPWHLLGAALALPWVIRLFRGGVPVSIAMVLSTLLLMVFFFAAWPAAQRIDQWTSADGLQSVPYEIQADGSLVPLPDKDGRPSAWPTLDFSQHRDFWRQQGVGQVETLQMLHGGLGFRQLAMAPLWARYRRFYDGG